MTWLFCFKTPSSPPGHLRLAAGAQTAPGDLSSKDRHTEHAPTAAPHGGEASRQDSSDCPVALWAAHAMAQDKTDTSGGEAGRGDAETVRSGARGVRGRRRDVSVGLFRCQAADERAVESHADTRAAVPLSSHPDASELLLNARVVVLAVHARAQAWCGAVSCPTTRVALQQLRANLEAAAGESKAAYNNLVKTYLSGRMPRQELDAQARTS